MAKRVRDNNGMEWRCIKDACIALDLDVPYTSSILRSGRYENKKRGIVLELVDAKDENTTIPNVFKQLQARFTPKELAQLAKGQGIKDYEREIKPIVYKGDKTYHIVVMSDSHIGSVYSPDEWVTEVVKYANDNKADALLHCGDIFEGGKIGRFGSQVYELNAIGADRQLEKACRLFSDLQVPMYLISGNHDRFFDEYAGTNLCKRFCENIEKATFVGDDMADISFGNVKVRMVHGGDGSTYALSYSLQKLIEGYKENEERPHLLFKGHLHKYCHAYIRGINAFLCPALQDTTGWMKGKRLYSQTGFLDITFDSYNEGMTNLKIKPIMI